jgi:hypothetical protein
LTDRLSAPLWVVTPYYNPAGYRRRLRNFHAFRRALSAPLLVVELAREGRHELGDDDADVVIRLTGEDRIWQKERLINVGVGALPRHVKYVAWADCDLLFETPDWPAMACERLERDGGLLQLFSSAYYMPRGVEPETATLASCAQAAPLMQAVSSVAAARTGMFEENDKVAQEARGRYELLTRMNAYGIAWAAVRSQFEACGLFDGNIMGGGDAVKTFALLDRMALYWRRRPSSPALRAYAERWVARAAAEGFIGRADNLEGRVFHLWHGEIVDRNYRGRHHILTDLDFDPARDVALAENGTWRWVDPDGPIACAVSAYFFARYEDGRPPAGESGTPESPQP